MLNLKQEKKLRLMEEKKPIWYIAGQDKKPKGPFAAIDLFNSIRRGQLSETTLCWRQGMKGWQSLTKTEPFQSALTELKKKIDLVRFPCPCGNKMTVARKYAGRQIPCTRCGRKVTIPGKSVSDPLEPVLIPVEPDPDEPVLIPVKPKKQVRSMSRMLIKIFMILIVIFGAMGAAAGAYFFLLDPPEVRKSKKLIETGFYDEAVKILNVYYQNHPTNTETIYLLAVANTNLLVAPETTGYFYNNISNVRNLLTKVFRAEPKLIEQAKIDFAAMCVTPQDLNQLQRMIPVYELRKEFKLVEQKTMAAELVNHARALCQNINNWQSCEKGFVSALEWDVSLANQLATSILDTCKIDELKWQRYLPLPGLVKSCPAFGKALSRELLRRAEDALNEKQYDNAEVFLGYLGRCDKQMLPAIAKKRRDYLTRLLAEEKVSEVVVILDTTCQESSEMKLFACELYVLAAKSLAAKDKAQAEKILLKAIELDATVLEKTENLLLYIKIGTPGRSKLQRLQVCLKDRTRHQDRLIILKAIVEDCLTLLQGRRLTFIDRDYLSASLEAGKELLAEHIDMPGLDQMLFDLAKCLRESNEYQGHAFDLLKQLIEVFLNSGLKQDMEMQLHKWQSEGPGKQDRRRKQVQPNKPERIESISRLKVILSKNDSNVNVMWVAISKQNIDEETLKALRSWAEEGHVLWLETDLTRDFGFTLPRLATQGRQGQALQCVGSHPLQFREMKPVGFSLAEDGVVFKANAAALERNKIWPILAFLSRDRRPELCVVCAMHQWKSGYVIFRPKGLPAEIEEKLLNYSLVPIPFQSSPAPPSGLRSRRR